MRRLRKLWISWIGDCTPALREVVIDHQQSTCRLNFRECFQMFFLILLLLVQGVNPGAEWLSDAESLMIHYGVMEDYFGAYHCHGFDAHFGHTLRTVTEGSRLRYEFSPRQRRDTSSIDMFFSLSKNDAMIRAALIAAWQAFVRGSLFWVPLAPVSNRGIQKSHYFLCLPQKQSSTL